MSVFDLYADLQFKKRVGKLSDKEAFLISFISTFVAICVFFFYSLLVNDLTTKQVTKLSPDVKMIIGVTPFIVGIFGIITNRFQKDIVKSQMKNYKQQGFSDKESLEQVLADKREYRGR